MSADADVPPSVQPPKAPSAESPATAHAPGGWPVLRLGIWRIATGRQYAGATDRFRFIRGWFACLALAATATLLFVSAGNPADEKRWARMALLGWTGIPPAFFWIDYFGLWRIERESETARNLEEVKHRQELSRNLWLAVVALLAVVLQVSALDGARFLLRSEDEPSPSPD